MAEFKALRPEVKKVMAEQLSRYQAGERVAADDVTLALCAVGADRWERGEVWRWAVERGFVFRDEITVAGRLYRHLRASRDAKTRSRQITVYVRTHTPAEAVDP